MIDLKLGDCLALMKEMPDNSVDAVITDPPYGIEIGKMGFTNNRIGGVALRKDYKGMGEWDDRPISKVEIDEIFRISRVQVIFGAQYVAHLLPPHGCWIVWDKKTDDKYQNDFADAELAWTNSDKPSRIIRHLWQGMLQQDMKNKEERFHPTQKPIAVMRKIIQMFTKEGETVLDPYMGSGSTGVACTLTRRNFVGFEVGQQFYDIAAKRINNARADMGESDKILSPSASIAPLFA